MTQKIHSSYPRASALTLRYLLQGLSLVASIGILGGGVVWAEEAAVPTDSEPVAIEAAPVEAAPAAEAPIAPETYAAPPEPESPPPETYAAPPEPEPAPQNSYVAEPAPEPEPAPEAPAAVAPPAPEEYIPEHQEVAEPPSAGTAADSNAYIDPTDYSVGAKDTYEAPTAVRFSDRSNGCDAMMEVGQAVGSLCAPLPSEPATAAAPSDSAPDWSPLGETQQAAEAGGVGRDLPPPEALSGAGYSPAPGYSAESGYSAAPGYSAESGYSSESGYVAEASSSGQFGGVPMASMGVAPIQVGPIAVSSMSNTGFSFYNLSVRPPGLPGNGNISLQFPLSIAAEITSPFGWREHPVLGNGRFHTGTDLGAPLGTPVLAAYAGQVAIADWLGGYGIAVVLDHNKQSLETLYGHLSEIFVKPGEWVQQGEVIGRVGSTGMSTGPHLHFELRKMTSEGWVAIDPGQQLELAMFQVVKTLQTAKVPQLPPQIVAALAAQKGTDLETGMPKLLPLPVGVEVEILNLEPPPLDLPEAPGRSQPKTKK